MVDIVAQHAHRIPICALIHFDEYKGPAFFAYQSKVLPITPATAHFGSTKSMSRTNLPLTLARAITIHKSQGAKYNKAVVNLGSRELSLGLTYVALSRVKTLFWAATRRELQPRPNPAH